MKIGLDIGSTTAKLAVIDDACMLIHSAYERHNTRIVETASSLLSAAVDVTRDCAVSLTITGSAGMGISENTDIEFIQELIAATEVVQKLYPEVKTLIDVGGEDSKMIFFSDNRIPDIRMNGNCAGGTGAFIDQMAALLNVETSELNNLAKNGKNIYPLASRCGVFAKTDVQNLISRKIAKEDIAAAVFHAVSVQCLNALVRGYDILPKVMFIGGPFSFLPELTHAFIKALGITKEDTIKLEHPQLISAMGAALSNNQTKRLPLSQFIQKINEKRAPQKVNLKSRLKPLFNSENEYKQWQKSNKPINIKRSSLKNYDNDMCFVGIDTGSTTTKIVAIGDDNQLLFDFYANNNGQPVEVVHSGLCKFRQMTIDASHPLVVYQSAVTGYGEDLIRAAFNIDHGVVETIAHYIGASHIDTDVSFILDIGGQDMKAIFVQDGFIQRIELNESCSSGCGSFIQTFANNLGMSVQDFAQAACKSMVPCDLGTRCTVFMNSKVKQALRENATVEDIAAGLSYSVIKNALIKVLNVTDMNQLGERLSVQGGTFRNPSIRRALELLTQKPVIMTDIPELMGAYGAAIIAKQQWQKIVAV